MGYTISETDLERQRLLAQLFEPSTRELLTRLDLGSVRSVIDLGCGSGLTTELLLAHLDPSAKVTGLDQDETLLQVARDRTSTAGESARVSFQPGAALALPFEDESFDLVFARCFLIHIPSPVDALKEMKRVCKPSGIVTVQDGTSGFYMVEPESWAFEALPGLWKALFANPSMGLQLKPLFQQLGGFESITFTVHAALEHEGNSLRRFMRMSAEATAAAVSHLKIMEEKEFGRLCDELRRVEELPECIVACGPTFSCSGVKSVRE